MKGFIVSLTVVMYLMLFSISYAAKIDVFTADNIIQIVKDKIIKTKTFTGSFVYTYNNKTFWGSIKYKSPNKFLMNFLNKVGNNEPAETGQKFVSDGKRLWLVFKDQNIAINEILEKSKNNPMIGWNLNRLLKEYIPTLPKTGYKVQYGNVIAYKLTFVPKSNTAGFKSINMIASDAGDILKVDAQNPLGVGIELAIKYDSFNQTVSDDDFEYEPDEYTQIYENILIPSGQTLNEEDNQNE